MIKNPYLLAGAQIYNKRYGLPPLAEGVYAAVDEALLRQVALTYDELPQCNLENIAVAVAYTHFAVEVAQQFSFATDVLGIVIEPWLEPGQPYANSAEMMEDVSHSHLYVFVGGEPHLLLAVDSPHSLWNLNTKFRAVHDLFGHAAEGYSFGSRGEWNAYLKHQQMYSYWAQKALATETVAQNAWYNFGSYLYDHNGNKRSLSLEQKPYPVQKIALLPEHVLCVARDSLSPYLPNCRGNSSMK